MSNTNAQLDFFNKTQSEVESGFGPSLYRIIGKMVFNMGYKVYARGLSNDETFFPFVDEKSQKEAQAASIALNKEAGNTPDKPPQIVYNFIVYKDDLLAGASGWNVDQHFIRDKWGEKVGDEEIDGAKVQFDDRIVYLSVLPFIQSGQVEPGKPFYGSLQNTASPWHVRRKKKTEKWNNAAGEEVVSYKTYKTLDAVFATQVEAQAAASSIPARGAGEVGDESWPGHFDAATKWKPADWDTDGKELIMKLLASGLSMDVVATSVAAPVEAVKLAVAQIEANRSGR